jgi:sortase A
VRLSRILGGIGRALIAFGVLLLLFVAYQLWGTGIHERRAQADLRRDLDALFGELEDDPAPIVEPDGGPGPTTTTTEPPLPPPEGEAVAVIRIPKIGLEKAVVEGVRVADLKKGPGHYPKTPMPGQPGNAAVAGHRTTYGAPFYRLDEMDPGEEIFVRTVQGEFRYVVETVEVVRPDQVEVLDQTDEARLTLTTCEPRFSARQRLIVSAVLEDEPAPAPVTTTTTPPLGEQGEDEGASAEDEPSHTVALEEDAAGLSGDPAARWPTFWWGLAAACVALVLWLLGRLWRPFWIYLGGAPVFLLVLFVFYENVSRLLPANI